MVDKKFNSLVKRRVSLIESVLEKKGDEYKSKRDRLHNFKVAARKLDCSPVKALQGMLIKHIVSVDDMIDTMENESDTKFGEEYIEEKIGDIINYYILLEALLKE